MVVTFLSDYGLRDEFVGVCHGVIARIAPGARVIDVTHEIEPQAVLQGAVVLANALPHMPAGVHLAVVDPGVGSARRGVCIRDAQGRLYVGPDNGLLTLAVERLGGAECAWELPVPGDASATFHGRDVFAPAAARLAAGTAPEELGPELDHTALVRLELPVARREGEVLHATVLLVDRFGNLQLNATLDALHPGERVRVAGHEAMVGRTFADAPAGTLLLYEDSNGRLALALSGGSAAALLGSRANSAISIRRAAGPGDPAE